MPNMEKSGSETPNVFMQQKHGNINDINLEPLCPFYRLLSQNQDNFSRLLNASIIYLSSWTKDSLSHIIWEEEEEEWLFCCHIWTSASHLCKMSYVEPYFA